MHDDGSWLTALSDTGPYTRGGSRVCRSKRIGIYSRYGATLNGTRFEPVSFQAQNSGPGQASRSNPSSIMFRFSPGWTSHPRARIGSIWSTLLKRPRNSGAFARTLTTMHLLGIRTGRTVLPPRRLGNRRAGRKGVVPLFRRNWSEKGVRPPNTPLFDGRG